LISERNLESSVSQLLVELLNDDLSLLDEVVLSGGLKNDFENMLSALIDSGSLSNDLSWDNQIVQDFVVNTGQGSRVRDLLVVLALLGDDGSLGNGEEIDVILLGQMIGEVSNDIDIFGLEGIWEIDDTAADLLVSADIEGVFVGLSDFDLRESVLLLFGLATELAQLFLDFVDDAGLDSHYLRFIKFNSFTIFNFQFL